MKRVILSLVIVCMVLSLCGCARAVKRPYSAPLGQEERQEDLDFLYENLLKRHKNPFYQTQRSVFEAKYAEIMQGMDGWSDVQYAFALQELAALVGDGHTTTWLDASRISADGFSNLLPFEIQKFDEGWFLVACDEAHRDYLGLQLMEINDKTAVEVLSLAARVISYDNRYWLEAMFPKYVNNMDLLRYLGVVKQEQKSLILTFLDENGVFISTEFVQSETGAADVRLDLPVPETAEREDNYWCAPVDEQTLFIQYNRCQEDPGLSMKRFVERVDEQLNQGNYKKIVVDLRFNAGGDSRVIEPLIKYLSNKKRIDGLFLYALIGRETYSSGLMAAISLQSIGAVTIGSPTGGSVNSYGEVKTLSLPNLPMTLGYSTKYFELLPGYKKEGLHPEIAIGQSIDNYLQGIDAEMAYILAIANSGGH